MKKTRSSWLTMMLTTRIQKQSFLTHSCLPLNNHRFRRNWCLRFRILSYSQTVYSPICMMSCFRNKYRWSFKFWRIIRSQLITEHRWLIGWFRYLLSLMNQLELSSMRFRSWIISLQVSKLVSNQMIFILLEWLQYELLWSTKISLSSRWRSSFKAWQKANLRQVRSMNAKRWFLKL